MDLGFRLRELRLHPTEQNGHLAVFQQGHSFDLGAIGGRETIQLLIKEGFTVLAVLGTPLRI